MCFCIETRGLRGFFLENGFWKKRFAVCDGIRLCRAVSQYATISRSLVIQIEPRAEIKPSALIIGCTRVLFARSPDARSRRGGL